MIGERTDSYKKRKWNTRTKAMLAESSKITAVSEERELITWSQKNDGNVLGMSSDSIVAGIFPGICLLQKLTGTI